MIMWQGIFLSLITLWLGSLAVGVFFFNRCCFQISCIASSTLVVGCVMFCNLFFGLVFSQNLYFSVDCYAVIMFLCPSLV